MRTLENEEEYKNAMAEINSLLDKGFKVLTQLEIARLEELSHQVANYEDRNFPLTC